MHQAVAVSMRDGAKCLHAARGDDHPRRLERTAGDRGAHVVGPVDFGRQRLDLLARVWRLVEQGTGAPLADNQVRLDVRLPQPLEQANAVNHTGGAGDSDYQLHENPKTQIPDPKSQQIPKLATVLGFGAWDLGLG